ncbi:MAG: 3-dehydroquinate synthase [Bacteroidales bacterium]|nr:3-dehydroquinate synthase [Bacteroidales bacterium]
MEEIRVVIGGRTASRVISADSLQALTPLLEAYPKVFLVYDRNVAWVAQEIAAACPPAGMKVLDASEKGKDMATVLDLCSWLLEAGADRSSLLLAVGGGITTDLAGFAACIYRRGIRFAFVPTTLLAQVDAAIGGKTGVNFLDFKNMLGVIRQPEFTFECAQVLRTLPRRDFLSGAAELLKTFLIDNTGNAYEKTVAYLSAAKASDQHSRSEALQTLIAAAAKVKAGIVSRDEQERGERRCLNLGHTFAHAIEHEARQAGLDVTHGEAVAVGILLAARLSEAMGLAPKGLAARLEADWTACGLPTGVPFDPATLTAAMTKDKKAEGDTIHFVLLSSIGQVEIRKISAAEATAQLL